MSEGWSGKGQIFRIWTIYQHVRTLEHFPFFVFARGGASITRTCELSGERKGEKISESLYSKPLIPTAVTHGKLWGWLENERNGPTWGSPPQFQVCEVVGGVHVCSKNRLGGDGWGNEMSPNRSYNRATRDAFSRSEMRDEEGKIRAK